MRRFMAVVLIALGGMLIAAAPVQAKQDTPNKVYVCKYVGTPGVDERLQTGQNPIDVSVNAIGEDPVVVGSYFNDAQGRSYVLAFDTGQPEPDVSECPGSGDPTTTTTTEVTTSTTTVPVTTTSVADPTTTTTSPQSSTTTTTEATTTTTQPPETTTSTTEPVTTTVPVPIASTTTSPPGSTTTTAAQTTTDPAVKPPSTGPVLSPPPAPVPQLAYTGSDTASQVFLGLLFLFFGFLLLTGVRGVRRDLP